MTRSIPLVSIGLPVYNGERYLREAVDSLLAQTFTDFELVLSDNASTDGTAEICREYATLDKRIRYVRNDTNIGLNRNCNQVVRLSVGKYFKLAAADDVCHPELLAKCVKVLDEDPTVVSAHGKTRFIDSDGNSLALSDPGWHLMSDRAEDRLRHVITSGHWVNLFYGLSRAADLAHTRLFAPYASGDYRLLGELCLRGKFCEIPESLFFRRIHSEASTQSTDPSRQSEFFKNGPRQLPFWNLLFDHARTILSSDLSAHHKLSCLRGLARRTVSSRNYLVAELHIAWKSLHK
jgi:glycosyltransferase involved in cell wall biosynthesis